MPIGYEWKEILQTAIFIYNIFYVITPSFANVLIT